MHYTTAAEAVKLIRSNDSVYIQGSTSIPEALVAAMAERGGELEHVTVYSAFAVGAFDAPYCRPEYKESFLVNSLFVANNIRRWLADGYGQTIPAFLGEIPALFRDGTLPLDVALINVSPPDAEGYCSFGVSADLAVSAVECAKTIIAQVNRAMPYSYGDAVIHTSRLAAAVEVDSPLVEVPTAVPSETERKIGSYIAELIPDGATLQIGVGGIPNAVLAALGGHRHLGLHTEAMTDGVLPLLESGVIDNSQKAVMPGVTVASLALGSRRLYDYMDYRKDLVMKDVAWTNDPFRIRQNPKVMAINSAVEVDLTGQVCADSVGMRIISGVGGQHDFMYGGALSEGGKTFIAIPSTTPKGESKIRALLSPGAGATFVPVDTRPTKFQLTLGQLEAAATDRTKAIVLTSPNNPTGCVLNPRSLDAVAKFAKAHDAFVICDDVYTSLVYEGVYKSDEGVHLGFASCYGELRDRIIVCDSFSKPYAMTGWRLGWVAADAPISAQIAKMHQYMVSSVPSFVQRAAIRALKEDVAPAREVYRGRRDYVLARLREIGLDVVEPDGAFYVFPSIDTFGMSSNVFCTRLIAEKGVALVPGSCFAAEGFVRLSYCCSMENLEEGLNRLAAFVQTLEQRFV